MNAPASKPTRTMAPDMRTAALELAELGFRVFPLRPATTEPAIADWPEVATTNPRRVDYLWSGSRRRCNIGIATGHAGLFVVDLADLDTLDTFTSSHPDMPDTVGAFTGEDRVHFYFYAPADASEPKPGSIAPGVTVHSVGGFVVAPPSLHPTGIRSRWLPGYAVTARPIADAPASLLTPRGVR